MVKRNDAISMFGEASASLLTDEENSIIGLPSREGLGLSKYPVRNIVVADIKQDSDVQFRQKPFTPNDDSDDASLLSTMGDPNIGLLQPIMVQEIPGVGSQIGPFGQGKIYRMIFGHRRLACARILGWEKIHAHVAKPDEEVSAFTLTENSGGKSLNTYEKAMSIRQFITQNPHRTQSDIAGITGWERSYISRLIRVTENDVPKRLLVLFAEGVSLKVITALIPVFCATDISAHDRLAEALEGCSVETAEKISDDIKQHIDPFQSITSYDMYPKRQFISNPTPNKQFLEDLGVSVLDPEVNFEKPRFNNIQNKMNSPREVVNSIVPGQPQDEKNAPKLPSGISPTNEAIVEHFAIENGTSKALAKSLIAIAHTENLTREELEYACLISANIGNANSAVDHLMIIMADKRAYSGFKQYVKAIRLILKTIAVREKEHDSKISTALRESVFTPLPLFSEKPEIRKR